MAEKMLKFVSVEQHMPDKRASQERVHDFDEIYARFSQDKAAEQSSRCSQCGIPFCPVHCPLHNNIPDWLKLTAEGRLEEAYEISSATSNMPEICGRICPQARPSEANCVIEKGFDSVTIGSVEKYITDTAWDRGWVKPPVPRRELGKSIGIVGAGPAGMSAAEQLRRKGYEVHIYDRYDRVGARPDDPMSSVFSGAMREWRRTVSKGIALTGAARAGLQQRIEQVMGVTVSREMESLEKRMIYLASVGSTAPFIGLFGTVWGIMNSFQSIAVSKNTSLAVVAPGIAEALFATALGLVAAVPAVIAYNKLSTEIARYAQRLDGFAAEFMTILSRQLEEAR